MEEVTIQQLKERYDFLKEEVHKVDSNYLEALKELQEFIDGFNNNNMKQLNLFNKNEILTGEYHNER